MKCILIAAGILVFTISCNNSTEGKSVPEINEVVDSPEEDCLTVSQLKYLDSLNGKYDSVMKPVDDLRYADTTATYTVDTVKKY